MLILTQNRSNESRSGATRIDQSRASWQLIFDLADKRPWQPVTRTQPDKLVTNVLNENSPKRGEGWSDTRVSGT